MTDSAGLPVVTAGQTITQAIIDRAIAAGQMHGVALSAGYDQAGDAVAVAKDKAGDLGDAAKVKLAQADQAIQDKHGDLLVGKKTGRAVLSDAGAVIVPADIVITQADVLAARSAGKLDDLTLAVGAAALETTKASVATAYDTTKDHVAAAYDATKAGADNVISATQQHIAATQERIAAEQASAPVSAAPVTTAPAAIAPVAPVTIIIEHPENVTVQTPGHSTETPGTAVTSDADLQKS